MKALNARGVARMANLNVDIVIVGASFGGVSAALAAATYGKSAALISADNHVGGQATSQGLTRWDETAPVMQKYGSSKSYQTLKNDIRWWYSANAHLAPGVDPKTFNPGFRGPGHPFSADSHITETILQQLLRDVQSHVTLVLNNRVIRANMNGNTVQSLVLANGDVATGKIFIDATDLGELLPLCDVEWVIGAEAQSDTQEPHAPPEAHREHIQPITVSIAIENRPMGENHTIQQPLNYSPAMIAAQAFGVCCERNGMIGGMITSTTHPGWESLFDYRKYIDHRNFADGNYANDRTTINVGCNDYQNAVIPTGDPNADAQIVEDARNVSLGYLYWLQTAAPRDDGGGQGYPNLMVRTDIFGRADGTAPQAYIRESRRIAKPAVRVVEQNIAGGGGARAPMNFSDSCGICWYPIDVHQCYGPPGTPWVAVDGVKPFQIPLGSLIATDLTNLIAGCKNLGTTHLTSGAYRVHPGEWAVGEAAGTLAAYCVGQNVSPAQAHAAGSRIAAMQLRLLEQGVPIFWWDDVTYDQGKTFIAAHLLGVRGYMADSGTMHFRPNDNITQQERSTANTHVGRTLPWPNQSMTRAAAAQWLCGQLGLPLQ